jgi:signal transduction histidine kinase/AraC-like DNA-binding protein/ABC-type sugar transport system substrate-binding protein/DNA-binding LytR/AlgR family response regulator
MISNDVDFVPVGPWNTDGLVVINPLLSASRSQYIQDLVKAGHPIVFISSGEGQPAIVADNAGGISQAISHLMAHGHQSIAYLAGNAGDPNGDSGERLAAYRVCIDHYGLNSDPRLSVYGLHSFDGGHIAMQKILASHVPFTAVLASNDESAMGAMKALKEAGKRIPEDVAIIGFDDRPEAIAQVPPLTSVHVPLYKSGYQAVEVLLRQINGHAAADQSLKIPTQLVLRQSCGCHTGASTVSLTPSNSTAEPGFISQQAHLTRAMAEPVIAETQRFSAEEAQAFCEELVRGFISSLKAGEADGFQLMVEELLGRVEDEEDDAHIWQQAISNLRLSIPALIKEADRPDASRLAQDMIDQARDAISERMRRQHGRYVLDQKWMTNRIGSLTARLLMTSDRSEILEVLANYLPAMGIKHASLSFFEADHDDPAAWSELHVIPGKELPPLRFPTRQFPPEALYPHHQPFSLVLLPIVGPLGPAGFMAYDSINIELDGPITQQIAAALNNARLYREANEGRKLAEEADRLKSRLLSTVSHELRTPLNLIVGLSEILLQKRSLSKQSLSSAFRKDVEQIYASAQHLGRLIQDVLDLASSEVGQLRLANELLDLGETLEMVVSTGRQLAIEKGLTWQDSLPETRLWVWGDRTRLRQVALNLVSNAIKFTSLGGVSFQVESSEGKAVVLVKDTGLGIALEEQSLIFEEFHRTELTTARGYGGIGLGLAICKRLVEMQGGEIGVHSSGAEGAGSTFYFSLPLIEPETIQIEGEALPSGLEQSVTLFTAPSANGERLREHLTSQGLEVNLVEIDQTMDWMTPLLKSPPGAVILDIGMAPTRGWKILKLLKENPGTQSIPVLLYSLTDDKGAILELNYLTKPVGTAELTRVLEYQKLASGDGRDEKIFLIVDDDPATLEMYVRIAQSWLGRHKVLKARNGREALELMQQQRPDLILLDLMMPELDGFGVLEAMREKESTRDIPVIVLTGKILTENDMVRLNRGVARVLEKGLFSVQETLNHIDTVLARKRNLGSDAQRLVRQAMAYLHERYTQAVSRQDLARYLGMSGDYLTFCFRKEVGMTPIAYLNRYRINQAKVMLSESDKNITEIAMSVGFSDSSYFSRVFRRQVGVSPEAFRKN